MGLWIIAVGLSLFTPLGQVDRGRLLYGLAGLVGLASIIIIDREAPLVLGRRPSAQPEPRTSSGAARVLSIGLLLLAIACSATSVYLLAQKQAYGPANWAWAGSLCAVLLWALIVDGKPISLHRWRVERRHAVEGLVLVGIIATAIYLRFPGLAQVPPEVHGDEAAIGLEARRVLTGGAPNLFGVGWYDVPMLSFAIPASTMRIFGDDLFGLRLASAIQGTISVLLLYALTRRLFGVRAAAIAAALLALSQWHIHFSRTGFHYMQALLATLLVIYFLVRAFDSRRALDFELAGFAAGLCFNVTTRPGWPLSSH